jgi:hypothetical protein
VRVSTDRCGADKIAYALRTGIPSVFARVAEDRVVFDMRTVAADEVAPLIEAARRSLGAEA